MALGLGKPADGVIALRKGALREADTATLRLEQDSEADPAFS